MVFTRGTPDIEFIRRRDVPGYLHDETFVSAWNEWHRYLKYGLPHGSGWRNERPVVIQVFELFDAELGLYNSRIKANDGR